MSERDEGKPPQWYSEAEMYDMLKRCHYTEEIAKELSADYAQNLQLAFEKGYSMGALALRSEREAREKAEAALERIKYACKENDEESCAAGLFGEASAWRRVGLLATKALSLPKPQRPSNDHHQSERREESEGMSKLFQITEEHLAELEHMLPVLMFDAFPLMAKDHPSNNRVRRQWERVKDIVAGVRWGYGPPADVGSTPADEFDNPNDGEGWKTDKAE